ncbi:hypothetical protein MBLNU13_g04301t2 [Cladosporium sp. NU13]
MASIDEAELYKLNVYSAPNGKFKPHVDTPRSEYQIGSLVVSLPSPHEGSHLTVSNTGAGSRSVIFDWSTTGDAAFAPGEIRWAAFYSNYEHEVHEVTSSHRVTLTYNLYLTRGVGHLAGASSAPDPTQLPLYGGLQTSLDNPGFLRHGRILAMYLAHFYAHTSAHGNFLPDSLKGADMSLWSNAQELGLRFQRLSRGDLVDEDDEKDLWAYWLPGHKVLWLTNNGYSSTEAKKLLEVQVTYPTYGNEPDIGFEYTHAAMLIPIPPYRERVSGTTKSEFFWEGIDSDCTEDDEYVFDESTSNCSSDNEMN